MAIRLKDGVFQVSCKHAKCPFKSKFGIRSTVMGETMEDVEREARRIVRDMAVIKHDAIYGRHHTLERPVIRKVAGQYVRIGAAAAQRPAEQRAVTNRTYRKGELVLKKGELANTVCSVVKGSAYPRHRPSLLYGPGDTFGIAALMANQKRMADVVAAEDGTVVAFYDLGELSRTDPERARHLYAGAMRDVFDVLSSMDQLVEKLEKKIERLKKAASKDKERIAELEAASGKRTPTRTKSRSAAATARSKDSKRAKSRSK